MKKEKICGIYKIENILNGNIYIGQSTNIKNRFKSHKSNLRLNKHCNIHLQYAWNKYGEENFEFSILEVCDCSELNEKERNYICKYNSFRIGYNRDLGGGVGRFSDETIEKIRKSNSNPSKETREKMRNSQKKKPMLQIDLNGNVICEWSGAREASKLLNIKQDCIWACCHHKRKTYKGFIWIFKNEYEIKFNLNDYYNKTASKAVCQYDLEGNLIKIWDTLRMASKYFEVDNSYLSKCCRKDLKCKNYKWKYYEDIISN